MGEWSDIEERFEEIEHRVMLILEALETLNNLESVAE